MISVMKELRPKKISLFSGNRPEITHPHSQMCVRLYIFSFKKKSNKQTKTRIKKVKETKEEKILSPENQLKN